MPDQTTQDLLLEHFLNYQKRQGQKKTVKEFAAHVGGAGYTYFSQVFNGRDPSEKYTRHLAEFFDDPRFYDAGGVPRPDPRLYYVQSNWGKISEEGRQRIADLAEKYSTKHD